MAWIKIKEIHKKDAYYQNRKELIGKRFSDKDLTPAREEIGKPWMHGHLRDRYFQGVKVEKA